MQALVPYVRTRTHARVIRFEYVSTYRRYKRYRGYKGYSGYPAIHAHHDVGTPVRAYTWLCMGMCMHASVRTPVCSYQGSDSAYILNRRSHDSM